MDAKTKKRILISVLLFSLLLIVDQVTKALVVAFIEYTPYRYPEAAWEVGDGLFRLIHVRNLAVAFSMGAGFPLWVRKILFVVLPLILLIALSVEFIRKITTFKVYQMVSFASILSGGFGNLIDRIFRPLGVVDFIDTPFLGWEQFEGIPILEILSFQRWPTYNIADSCIFVGVLILIVGMLVESVQEARDKRKK